VELLRLGVLDGIAEEGPVERENACALGNEETLEPVVGFSFVSNTWNEVSINMIDVSSCTYQ
jgi:hypothetical protein